MGGSLPFELVAQIACYRRHDLQNFITQYALVCRQWQAAFEPHIYDRISVHSEDFQTGKGNISLAHYRAITSNSDHARARLSMLKAIRYRVILPFDLPDCQGVITEEARQTYTPDNATRRANNVAFQAAIVEFFNLLTTVPAETRVTLKMETLGREVGHEPGTEVSLNPWGRPDGARGHWVVRPYRAELADKKCPLPRVLCVDQIVADGAWYAFGKGPGHEPYHDTKHIRLETAFYIAQACPTLSYFRWEVDDVARPEHFDYALERRRAFAESLLDLPATLQTLDISSLTAEVLHDSLPAPVLFADGNDLLSTNLRHISARLRQLHLYEVPVANDFLCPLDDNGEPRPGERLEWPNLSEILMTRPNFLPSGEWLLDPNSDAEDPGIDMDALADPDFDYGEEVYRLVGEDAYYWRSQLKSELYRLSLISLGYAARHMPRLEYMSVGLSTYPHSSLCFARENGVTGNGEGEATLTFEEENDRYDEDAYRKLPRADAKVARAWGFDLGELETEIVEGKIVSKVNVSRNIS
ncbi:hypothetical protein BJX68DRAFT_231122 [Aspergillus pseudodeflectus]|uniref:F-box domain-containing protein n=1 Tax=Aspergillus pseudodeflectus TaxID=176178 RepID=A0ABR4KWZ7_9EURO